MADVKISGLPASTTPLGGTEVLPIVQGGVTSQVSVANLTASRAVAVLSLTSTNDSTFNGATVGKGGGAVATNTAIGLSALAANTVASNLTATGYQALLKNTTNVATLGAVTGGTGYTNGTYTGVVMTLSSGSTAVTYPTATIVVAGGAVTTVTITSAGVGFKDTTTVLTAPAASIGGTGSGFTVPVATLQSGTNNSAFGYQALVNNTTGFANTAVGYLSLQANTTGIHNYAFGYGALQANTTGSGNVSVGYLTLGVNTTGTNNTAIGGSNPSSFTSALGANLTGNYNVAVGGSALSLVTASTNTGLGFQAGNNITTGSNNVCIGYAAQASAAGVSNEITLGNASVTSFRIPALTITAGAKWINVGSSTVALLPAAATAGLGARAFVTNALTPAFGSAVVGGGAVAVPVYSDGTSWLVG
jgi:hypothetical protein